MIAMLAQFFNTLRILFMAGERAAGALNHGAGWAEDSMGAMADTAKIKRQADLNALMLETGVTLTIGGQTSGSTEVAPVKRIK